MAENESDAKRTRRSGIQAKVIEFMRGHPGETLDIATIVAGTNLEYPLVAATLAHLATRSNIAVSRINRGQYSYDEAHKAAATPMEPIRSATAVPSEVFDKAQFRQIATNASGERVLVDDAGSVYVGTIRKVA